MEMYLVSSEDRLLDVLNNTLLKDSANAVGVGFFSCLPTSVLKEGFSPGVFGRLAQTDSLELVSSPQFLTHRLKKMCLNGRLDPTSSETVLLGDETGFASERRAAEPTPENFRTSALGRWLTPSPSPAKEKDPLNQVPNWLIKGLQPLAQYFSAQNSKEKASPVSFRNFLQNELGDIPAKIFSMNAESVIWILDTDLIGGLLLSSQQTADFEKQVCADLPLVLASWFVGSRVKELALVCRNPRIQKQILLQSGEGSGKGMVDFPITFRL